MTELNLENIRKDIDDIDSELTALFKKRMEKSLEVARFKRENNLPVFSDSREKEILHKVSQQIGEPFDGYARLLFNTIFDASRTFWQEGPIWQTGSKRLWRRLRRSSPTRQL